MMPILRSKEEPENSQSNRAGAVKFMAGGQARLSRPVRALVLSLVLLSPVALVSCGNPSAQTPAPVRSSAQIVATEISKITDAVIALQTSIIHAHGQNIITNDQAAAVVQITVKVMQGIKEANGVARDLNRLSQANKVTLLGIFNPIINAVDDSLKNGLIPIKDQNILNITRGALTGIQISLAVMQASLQGAN